MGCCAARRRPGTWSPNPLLGFRQGYFPGFVPSIGDVETSAGAIASKRSSGSCCDACDAFDVEHAKHPAEESSCLTGECGINRFTAGMKLPLSEYSVNAGARNAGATMDQQVSAWTDAAFGGRQAGVIMPLPPGSNWRASTQAELDRLETADLEDRLYDVDLALLGTSISIPIRSFLNAEKRYINNALTSRRTSDSSNRQPIDDFSANDDATDRPLTESEFREKKEELAGEVARRLEPGNDPASARRRDQIIAQAITGTLATFNQYLQREYDAQVTTINANRDITLQTLRNEDRQRDREYQLQLRQLGGGQSLTSGGGGSGAIVGIGLLGLLLSMSRK